LRAKRIDLVVIIVISALSCGNEAIAQNAQAFVQFNRALKLISHGHSKEGLESLNESIRLDPNYGVFYEERGALELRMEQRQAAESDLHKAIVLCPTHAKGHSELARCLFEDGRSEEAIVEINKAITLEKRREDISNLLCTRARIYTRLGSITKGIEDINAAIKLRPDEIWSYSQRADMYFFAKNYQKALEEYTRLLDWKKPPEHAVRRHDDWFEMRARCYEKLGRKDLAAKDRLSATKALEKDPYAELVTPTIPQEK